MSGHGAPPVADANYRPVGPTWWWVDHFDSDREYHLYCPGCRAQIPAFLVRFESRAPMLVDGQCEGCGTGG